MASADQQPDQPSPTPDGFIAPTERTQLKRAMGRGCFDRATIHAILDEALVCTVSFTVDGRPFAIPMAFARIDDALYLHGSTANRMMRTLRDGGEACITVTLLDGLVLARSAFHHSVNFRCVVLYAGAEEVTDPAEKLAAMRATVEHVVPGRWDDVRPPNREEFVRTMILRLPIEEASAKLRSGPPIDDPEDLELTAWAGVVPIEQTTRPPVADPFLAADVSPPDYASRYRRPRTE